MIQLYLFLPLLVFFFAGILLLLVLHGKSRSRVHRMFALLLLALGLWGLTIFGMRSSGSLGAAIAWERFALTAVLAVSLFFYHFTVLFTRKKAEAYLLPSLYLLTLAATGLVAAGMVVPEMELAWYGYAPRPGQFFIPYLAVVYSINFLGIWNLVRYYRNPPSEAARNRTIYILLGVGCSLLGGLVDSLPPLMSTYPIGMLGNLLLAFFTAVAILKHNLLDARVVIKKGVVYSIVSGIIMGAYVVLLFSLNLLFQNNAMDLSWPGNLAALLTVAIFLKPVVDRVQGVADRWFSRRRHDYFLALEAFSRETKDVTDLRQLANALEQAVTLAMGAENVRLLVPTGNDSGYISPTVKASNGSRPWRLQRSSTIVNWLRSHDDVLRAEDLQVFPIFLALSDNERTLMESFEARLFIPLKKRGELAGILVLAKKRSDEPYSDEDLGLLRAATNQTALALANAGLFASVVSQRTRLEHLLERVIRAQEDERKRLSMELHDSPVQWLTSAVYRVEACLEFFNRGQHDEAHKEVEPVQRVLDTTLLELRHTTAALHPPELEKVGLIKALARYADSFERDTGILTHFKQGGDVPRLSAPVELAVYRVVQEALSNVRKHAQATQVQIQMGLRNGAFWAEVRDNGTGFDMDEGRREDGHLGLIGMEERARMLGGTLTVRSMPGAETQITLQIPSRHIPTNFEGLQEAAMAPQLESS